MTGVQTCALPIYDVTENADESDQVASSSLARAVRSITEAAQARPTTKLLDSEALPKLDAPTHPFQRLRVPLRIKHSLDNDVEKNKDTKRKKKRPVPAKIWRKKISREEKTFEGNGMSSINSKFIIKIDIC